MVKRKKFKPLAATDNKEIQYAAFLYNNNETSTSNQNHPLLKRQIFTTRDALLAVFGSIFILIFPPLAILCFAALVIDLGYKFYSNKKKTDVLYTQTSKDLLDAFNSLPTNEVQQSIENVRNTIPYAPKKIAEETRQTHLNNNNSDNNL